MIQEPGIITPPIDDHIECPYKWVKSFVQNSIENAVLKGDLISFFNMFSERLQKEIPYIVLGRLLAQVIQLCGNFVSISQISEPLLYVPGTDIWLVNLELKTKNDSSFVFQICIDGNKKISSFSFSRIYEYVPPNYIKPELFEREKINEDPLMLLSKPINSSLNSQAKESQYPCVLFIHTQFEDGIDLRSGLNRPGLDFEYLPSNKIGLIRSQYTDQMFHHDIINGTIVKYNDPVLICTTKMIEIALSRNDISHIFLILHSFASLSINSIVKKFQGIIQGIILINPLWKTNQNIYINSMKQENVPNDIPILLLGGGYSQNDFKEDYKIWEAALKKNGNECEFYDHCDMFLFESPNEPLPNEYSFYEKHVSDVPLRRIAQWIRSHLNS
ncbi:hypothetical protein M9Y10_044076 [Tritrichomonas musculus]|uniref:Uncharacterized protein n=1 Tax=Tritrichomonas musculus TaxID=1915356 RepID=A0ABR2K236_9EUKA